MNLKLTRRRFLLGSAATACAVGTYTWRVEPHWVAVTRRDMPIRDLPSALEGRTLAQISDLHVSPHVDPDYLCAAMREVAALQPDILCVTGDFVSSGHAKERVGELLDVLKHLPEPPLGRFASFGNHDFGERWSDMAVAAKLERALTDVGFAVLRNAGRDVHGLRIVGLDDLWSPNFQPKEVRQALAVDGPAVALCHNPDTVDGNIWGAFRGWILSGHTHGGQCKSPFLPPPIVPVANKRWTSGEFDLGDGRTLYINRGLGYLWRVRFNARPEITLFTLTRA